MRYQAALCPAKRLRFRRRGFVHASPRASNPRWAPEYWDLAKRRPGDLVARLDSEFFGSSADDLEHKPDRPAGRHSALGQRLGIRRDAADRAIGANEDHVE